MIFVTTGTQLPFDRLIRAMDEIAPDLGDEEIIAQAQNDSYVPHSIKVIGYLSSAEYKDIMSRARLIVSHAGTGTIISALMLKKPIIVMPRYASLGEHRNEHQSATVKKFEELQLVYAAYDSKQLQDLVRRDNIKCRKELGSDASDSLIHSLKNYILDV